MYTILNRESKLQNNDTNLLNLKIALCDLLQSGKEEKFFFKKAEKGSCLNIFLVTGKNYFSNTK